MNGHQSHDLTCPKIHIPKASRICDLDGDRIVVIALLIRLLNFISNLSKSAFPISSSNSIGNEAQGAMCSHDSRLSSSCQYNKISLSISLESIFFFQKVNTSLVKMLTWVGSIINGNYHQIQHYVEGAAATVISQLGYNID